MKNYIIFNLFVVFIMLASCSKEVRFNNSLDGKWNATLYSGAQLPAGTTMTTTFSKGTKNTGNYTTVITINGNPTTEFGAYNLTQNTKITFSPVGTGNVPYSFTVDKRSKSKIELINGNNVKTVYIKAN